MQFFQGLWIVLAGGVALLLPGAAWQAWFPLKEDDFGQRLASAMGLSLALTTLGALVTYLANLTLSGASLVVIYGLLAGLTLAGWLRRRPTLHLTWGFIAAFLLLGVVIAWRLYQARSLALPAWVDSVHHTLIVRMLLDRGGLRGDMLPYLPVPFYYHFGFHSLTAVFSFFSGLAPYKAVLIMGQVLNAGVCLAIYRLGAATWRDPRRGLAAALLVAFFSQMPAYYLTWGRYTLLAGIILLALAMAEVVEFVRDYRPEAGAPWRFALRMGLFTTGVLLCHYLAALLLALFLVLVGLYLAARDLRSYLSSRALTNSIKTETDPANSTGSSSSFIPHPSSFILWQGWLPLLLSVLAGTLIALPWVWRALSYSTGQISLDVTLPSELGGQGFSASYASYLWYLSGPQRNYWLLLLGFLGMLWALADDRRQAASVSELLAVWSALVALGCLPIGINLAPFHPHHMVMVAFLPASLLAGSLLVACGDALGKVLRRAWLGQAAVGTVLLLLSIWGGYDTRNILNPVTVFANAADRQALDWVAANTPAGARFYINTTLWQGGVYRGVDGGWWMQPYNGRQALLPVVFYSMGTKEYMHQVNVWAKTASQVNSCSSEFWALVADAKLSYVYIHQGLGSLQPAGLQGCPRLDQVYSLHGVYIYKVTP
jgi:hypothetical protein